MKIALGVGFYYPDSIGGTEKYIHDLAIYLLSQNIEVVVIAPSVKGNYSYLNEEVKGREYKVYRFEVPKELTHEEVTDKVICRGYENFENLVDELRLTIFHLHTLSTTLNYRHLKIAKEKGIKTLFTAHIPGIICPKGNFINYPNQVCNGKLTHSNCGYCYAQWRHENKLVAEVTGRLATSSFIASLLENKIPQFGIVKRNKNILHQLEQHTDYVIAVCQWLYDAFLINNISPNHLKICRQGVSINYLDNNIASKKETSNIRIGCIGRLEPIKGLHILLNAYENIIKKNPQLPLELHIVGVKQELYQDYYQELQHKIQTLPNITYQENLPSKKVSEFMIDVDFLCIPSTCLETGPIVAYEAFANKTPIIGANIGGVAELVEDGKTGFLYQFNNLSTFEEILLKIATHPALVKELSKNITLPRTTQQVGEEMLTIYQSLK